MAWRQIGLLGQQRLHQSRVGGKQRSSRGRSHHFDTNIEHKYTITQRRIPKDKYTNTPKYTALEGGRGIRGAVEAGP